MPDMNDNPNGGQAVSERISDERLDTLVDLLATGGNSLAAKAITQLRTDRRVYRECYRVLKIVQELNGDLNTSQWGMVGEALVAAEDD